MTQISPAPLDATKQRNVQLTLLGLMAILAVMISLVIAAPTLYRIFCSVTGYGGTVGRVLEVYERPTALISGAPVVDQPFQMLVAADVQADAPLKFRVDHRRVDDFKIGQRVLLNFSVQNTSDAPILAQAIHTIQPEVIAGYFEVQECFCTDEQVLEPGKLYEYPLVLRFAPDAASNRDVLREAAIQVRYEYIQK